MSAQFSIPVESIFSEAQLRRAKELGDDEESITREITEPHLPVINKKTGQENSAKYWAYVLIYWCQYTERMPV